MKRIKPLMELDFTPLLSTEAISTKGGGGEWRYDGSLGGWTYWLDEVIVTAKDLSFDYGEWWFNVFSGATTGGITGGMAGSAIGGVGAGPGAIGGALLGGFAGGLNNYMSQKAGY